MTMNKDAKTLVEGYKKYTGSDLKVQKTPGDPVTTPSKSDLGSEEVDRSEERRETRRKTACRKK